MIFHLNKNDKSVEIEMKDILARFTTDVIGNVAFGLDVNSMTDVNSKFREMGRRVFDTPPMQTMKVFFLTAFRKFTQKFSFMVNNKEVSDFFLTSIRDNVLYREDNNISRNDFFSLLLQLKHQGKIDGDTNESTGKLTTEELAAQSFLFFLAG